MTIPNGAAGINTADILFGVSAYGNGTLSPAELVGNDEATVRAAYAAKYVGNGNSVLSDPNGPLGLVWSGLRQGVSLPVSIIEAIVKQFFPWVDTSFLDDLNPANLLDPARINEAVQSVLGLIEEVPILGDLVKAITGKSGSLSAVTTFLGSKWDDLQGMLDGFVSTVTGIVTSNNPIGAFIKAVESFFGITTATAAGTSNNSVEISILKARTSAGASGKTLSDTFDGPSAATLGSAWAQYYSGPGGGALGKDGQGNTAWTVAGSLRRTCTCVYVADNLANTTYQSASWVTGDLDASIFAGGDYSYRYVLLRCDSTGMNYVYARTGGLAAVVGYAVGGVLTPVYTAAYSTNWNDSWEFKVGDTASTRKYILSLNGTQLVNQIESGTTSVIDPNNQFFGMRFDAGAGTYQQYNPGAITIVAASGRPAA